MKKIIYISMLVFMMLCLCACGSKTQPTPTAAPTAVPTEAAPTEEPVKEEPAAETIPETYDPDSFGSVYNYYDARGENIFSSYAFMQLDTEGKTTWTAPMAGIQEFRVPDAFLNAKGGVRASGGGELFTGSGLVTLDVVYLPFTKAEYDDFLDRIAKFTQEHDDPTDEDMAAYSDMINEYNDNVYSLFEVFGIGNHATLEDLKATIRDYSKKYEIPDEATEDFLSHEFIEAGSAEDYNFFLIKFDRQSGSFTEAQAEYKEEYDALYDAVGSYTANFSFMRPLALAQLVAEGTGLTFESTDLNDNAVNGSEMFASHKATMLNIWETTCSACMSEMPELIEMAEEFESKGGQLVGLVYDATDEDLIAEAKEISEDLGLDFVNLLTTQEMIDFFNVQAFPTTYFFNEKGEVVGDPIVGAAPAAYKTRMNEMLGE